VSGSAKLMYSCEASVNITTTGTGDSRWRGVACAWLMMAGPKGSRCLVDNGRPEEMQDVSAMSTNLEGPAMVTPYRLYAWP